jgi:hypothetical protein
VVKCKSNAPFHFPHYLQMHTIRVHTDLKTGNEIEFRAVANVVP